MAAISIPPPVLCRRVSPRSLRLFHWLLILMAVEVCGVIDLAAGELSPVEQLGKQLFFDTKLSSPPGQSCATCHAPEVGFTGPDSAINQSSGVYPGAVPGRFGNRKPPTVAYASFSPKRTYNAHDHVYVGGQFWDGRVDTLVEQAKGPFLNPLEMNNASAAEVVDKVRNSEYRALFDRVYGAQTLASSDATRAFDQIARAIAAYEASREVNSFDSKYDLYLAGRAQLTDAEARGLKLFAGQANCTSCHPHERGADGSHPLFTNFAFVNVGVPQNTSNPFYQAPRSVNAEGAQFRDLGLGSVLQDVSQNGKVKVPTLRNVAKKPHPEFVKAYLHNGHFQSLKEVVHFYNIRNSRPDDFGDPDVAENVNRDELGNLGLKENEEDDIVAFLETLSDGYVIETTKPSVLVKPASLHAAEENDRFRSAREVFRVTRFRGGISRMSPGNPANQR